jgi:small subunit ribosomal protein S20
MDVYEWNSSYALAETLKVHYDSRFSASHYAFALRTGIPIRSCISMANSPQALKRARQAEKARTHNASLRSTLRTAIKKIQKAILAGDKPAAQAQFQVSVSVLDRIADKKIIHKNKASRHKSRLSAAIKTMGANA